MFPCKISKSVLFFSDCALSISVALIVWEIGSQMPHPCGVKISSVLINPGTRIKNRLLMFLHVSKLCLKCIFTTCLYEESCLGWPSLGACMLVYTRKNQKLFSHADGAGVYLRRCLFVLFTKWTLHHRNSHKIAHTGPVSAFPLGSLGHAALVRSKNICFR